MKKTFIIVYSVFDKDSKLVKGGTMKVKNKATEFEAKCSLEDYLKKKHTDFSSLVIDSCKEELLGGMFDDIFGSNSGISDLFGGMFNGRKKP